MQKFSCKDLRMWQATLLILSVSRFCLSKVKWLIVMYVMTQTQVWKKVPWKNGFADFHRLHPKPNKRTLQCHYRGRSTSKKKENYKICILVTSIHWSSVSKFTSREFKGKFGRKSESKKALVSGCWYFLLFRLLFWSVSSQASESLVLLELSGLFFSFFPHLFLFPLFFFIKVKSCFSWCQ